MISFENEHEKKHMDPNPNHSDDLATFLHITKSTVLSHRPSHSDCSTKTVPVFQKMNSYCGMLSKFEIESPITIKQENSKHKRKFRAMISPRATILYEMLQGDIRSTSSINVQYHGNNTCAIQDRTKRFPVSVNQSKFT